MSWVPLHCHQSASLLDSIARPKATAKRCVELGYKACAVTDHGSVSDAVSFSTAMREVGIKPILGTETYLCEDESTVKTQENRSLSHLVILAKNREGWRNLLRLVSRSNEKERFYYNPRVQLEELRDFTQGQNLVAFSGHPGSDLGNIIFKSPKDAYKCLTYDDIKSHHIHEDAATRLSGKIEQYISIFGRENFFLEIQILDPELMPASVAIAKALRWASKKYKLRCVATGDSHYVNREDAADQRILLCNRLKTTLSRVRSQIDNDEDVTMGGFFRGNHFHVPSPEELATHHTDEEIHQANVIADMVDDYEITSPPRIPHFEVSEGHTQDSYLRELCEAGWNNLIEGASLAKPVEEYRDRLAMELRVMAEAGLSSYFSIVADVMAFSRKRGRWLGRARGSSGGSLIAYLTGITAIDPLKHDLIFERFYNAGRNSPGKVSLPDIDCDFPKTEGVHVLKYLQNKYGKDRVGKIATFQTMQGRSALDAVLAAHDIGFDLRKQITRILPDKARISEELQEISERGEAPSIIQYSLDTYGNELSEWVTQNDDGSLSGEFAHYFAQAIRLEGVWKAKSTHAAGVVISDAPLADVAPLRWDDDDECWIADMDYPDLEAMGLMKLDVLRITMLDKMEGVRNLAKTGRL